MGHGEVAVVLHLQDDPRRGRLDHVHDGLRVLAGQQQVGNGVDPRHVRLFVQGQDQLVRLLRRQRLAVRQQVRFRLLLRAGGKRRFRPVLLARQHGPGNLAGHFVSRMPARPHRHVGHAGVENVMGLVPADGLADFEGGAGAVGLVAGGVGAVQQHAVLHVDEAGEGHVPQKVVAAAGFLEQAEEDAVRVVHLAALHQGQPVVEALVEGAVKAQRRLVFPMRGRPWHHGARFRLVRPAPVMSRRLAQELVPRVEAGGHVPDGLRHGQVAQFAGQVVSQRQAGAAAQQAVVVVDEPHEAVVDALVVGDVGVRSVDAGGFANDFGQRTLGANQVVIYLAGAHLVAFENRFLQPVIQAGNCCAAHG